VCAGAPVRGRPCSALPSLFVVPPEAESFEMVALLKHLHLCFWAVECYLPASLLPLCWVFSEISKGRRRITHSVLLCPDLIVEVEQFCVSATPPLSGRAVFPYSSLSSAPIVYGRPGNFFWTIPRLLAITRQLSFYTCVRFHHYLYLDPYNRPPRRLSPFAAFAFLIRRCRESSRWKP